MRGARPDALLATSTILAGARRQAAGVFFDHPDEWRDLVARVMGIDNSWARRAQAYQDLYVSLVKA